jgi:hypothetical protein
MPVQPSADDFLAKAGHDQQRSLFAELLGFMRETRNWWMAPILIILGVMGVMLILGATGAAPFLYPLWGF